MNIYIYIQSGEDCEIFLACVIFFRLILPTRKLFQINLFASPNFEFINPIIIYPIPDCETTFPLTKIPVKLQNLESFARIISRNDSNPSLPSQRIESKPSIYRGTNRVTSAPPLPPSFPTFRTTRGNAVET